MTYDPNGWVTSPIDPNYPESELVTASANLTMRLALKKVDREEARHEVSNGPRYLKALAQDLISTARWLTYTRTNPTACPARVFRATVLAARRGWYMVKTTDKQACAEGKGYATIMAVRPDMPGALPGPYLTTRANAWWFSRMHAVWVAQAMRAMSGLNFKVVRRQPQGRQLTFYRKDA